MCSSSRFDPEWAHLDNAMTGGRATRRPRERGIEIGHVDDVVAAQLLLRVRKGAIQNLRLAIRDAYGRRSRARLEAARALQDARLRQCLYVRHISRHSLFLLGLCQLGPTGLVHIEHQNILHVKPPSWIVGGHHARYYNDARNPAIWTASDFGWRWAEIH